MLQPGITPAHAGKRKIRYFLEKLTQDHPRTRGEKPPARDPGVGRRWITPAHAGKSFRRLVESCYRQDHPRTRGEKYLTLQPVTSMGGSPPHTRGKVCSIFAPCLLHGITPAHAGKSSGESAYSGVWGDHPRTRGEKSTFLSMLSSVGGSPPHTRGKADGLSS